VSFDSLQVHALPVSSVTSPVHLVTPKRVAAGVSSEFATDRLNEKHTFFGQQGIKIVANFFKDDASYVNKPKAIAKYALWATRGNGPVIFSKPTPQSCTVAKGSNGYIVSFSIFFSFAVL